jgi:hypothetical protein
MKKYIINTLTLSVCILATMSISAQSAVSAGGDAYENSEAKVTITIGEATIGAEGAAEIGFQQAYESETVSIEETISELTLTIYPNPTADKVTIRNQEQASLSYNFYQMDGKAINTGETKDSRIELNLIDQAAGVYFLQFTNTDNNTTKTFKIIKK